MNTSKSKTFAIIFSFFLFSLGFGASAQYKHDPEKSAGKKTAWMKSELTLSDEQAAKIEQINLAYAKKSQEERVKMHEQMKNMRQEKNKEFASVLSPEQLEKFEALKAEKKGNKKGCASKGKKDCKKADGKKKCDKKK